MIENLKAKRLCSNPGCNTDFDLIIHNAGPGKGLSNHQCCPKCGVRNDIWVQFELTTPANT